MLRRCCTMPEQGIQLLCLSTGFGCIGELVRARQAPAVALFCLNLGKILGLHSHLSGLRGFQQRTWPRPPVSCNARRLPSCIAKVKHSGLHRASPLTDVKSLRWFGKHAEWQELVQVLHSPVISAYSKSTACQDRREAYPVPLSIVVAFEQAVCNAATPHSIALFMGSVLLGVHGSLRFGDSQHMPWKALQLSTSGLHGTCYATKTTKKGQPFACTWHGLSGKGPDSSWVLHWLGRLARLLAQQAQQHSSPQPDFAFINCTLLNSEISSLAPASSPGPSFTFAG